MTDSAGPRRKATREARRRFRKVALTLIQAAASTVALLVIYYLLPLDRSSIGVVIAILVAGLTGLVVLVIFQVRGIIRSSTPALRGVGALATSAPLFLLLFAGTYYVMGRITPGSFTEPLTRTDALYFTVTVFATVGFGDIAAKTEVARALVMGQMVAGIIIVGVGARIIVDAIKHGREQLPAPDGNARTDQEDRSE